MGNNPSRRVKKKRLPWYGRAVVYLLAIYLLYCGLLFFFQHKLIFPAGLAGRAQPRPFHPQAEVVTYDTPQGQTVGWFIPAPGAGPDHPAPLAIFLHGNAELIDQQHNIVSLYHGQGVSVLLPEYRGYGNSDGSPSQDHIVSDVVAFYDQAVARADVDGGRVVIHGRSIGGGIAAQLADRRPSRALIVESTGASVAGLAWRYGVPPFLVRSPFRTRQVLETLTTPVLILHGKHDKVFPYQHALDLLAAAPNGTLVPFESGHNTLGADGDLSRYREAVEDHLGTTGVVVGDAGHE